MGIKEERMRMLSNLNAAIAQEKIDKGYNILQTLIPNVKYAVDEPVKDELSSFQKEKENERAETIKEVNERAEEMDRIGERREFKRVNYKRAKAQYVTEMWEKITEIIMREELVPE